MNLQMPDILAETLQIFACIILGFYVQHSMHAFGILKFLLNISQNIVSVFEYLGNTISIKFPALENIGASQAITALNVMPGQRINVNLKILTPVVTPL